MQGLADHLIFTQPLATLAYGLQGLQANLAQLSLDQQLRPAVASAPMIVESMYQ